MDVPPGTAGSNAPSQARRAVAYSLAQRYCEVTINFVSLVIIARFVPPAEFGVYAIAAAAISLASLISAVGVSDYLVMAGELTRDKRGAALGLTLTTSTLLGLGVMGAGAVMVSLGGDAQFSVVLMVMATTLFIDPLKNVAQGLLRREMLFGAVFVLIVLGAACQAAVGIGLSAMGFGADGLACAFVVNSVVSAIVALATGNRFGGFPLRFGGWRDIFRFGWRQAAASVLPTIGKGVPTMIAGSVLGYAAAGLLSRSVRITSLFNNIVVNAANRAALPVLSRRRRDGLGLGTTFLVHTQYISVLSWPFFAILGLFAPPVVGALLGDDWLSLAPLVRILCLGGIVSPLTALLFTYYIALDRLGLYLRRLVMVQALVLVAAGSAAFWSVPWVAAAIVLETVLLACFLLTPLLKVLRVAGRDLWRALRSSVAATVIALLPMLALIAWFGLPQPDNGALLLAAVPFAGGAWLIGVYAARHPIAGDITALLRAARSAF